MSHNDDDVTEDYSSLRREKQETKKKPSKYAAAMLAMNLSQSSKSRSRSSSLSQKSLRIGGETSRTREKELHSERQKDERKHDNSIETKHATRTNARKPRRTAKTNTNATNATNNNAGTTAGGAPSTLKLPPPQNPLQAMFMASSHQTSGVASYPDPTRMPMSMPLPIGIPMTFSQSQGPAQTQAQTHAVGLAKPVQKHDIVGFEPVQRMHRENVLPALQFECTMLEDQLCEEISPFIIGRYIKFTQHEEIIPQKDPFWIMMLDELHIPEDSRRNPYDEKKRKDNVLIKRIIRDTPTIMDLLLKSKFSLIAILDRILTLWMTIISFGHAHAVTSSDENPFRQASREPNNDDENDDDDVSSGSPGSRSRSRSSRAGSSYTARTARRVKEPQDEEEESVTHLELPCLIHFQRFCTALDQEVAGRLRNWWYFTKSSKREDLPEVVLFRQFIRESVRYLLYKQLQQSLTTETHSIPSPLKIIEKAVAHHQEQQQQYGAIVGTFLDHRPQLLQKCYFMYQRHIRCFHQKQRALKTKRSETKRKDKHSVSLRRSLQEGVEKLLKCLESTHSVSVSIHRHNEKVQGVLTSLLEKIQKPAVNTAVPVAPKEKEKEKEKPNYRSVLGTGAAEDKKT